MPKPIVIAYHLMWTGYGWWLPNDPRGSMSKEVAFDPIAALGELHYGRRKIQPVSKVIKEFRQQSKEVLKHSLIRIGKAETYVIAESFAETVTEKKYTCYACAIMPDHIHVIIRKHKDTAEQMIENFQKSSRLRLRKERLFPTAHPVWGGPGWKVFLDHPNEIRRTIRYVEENPVKWKLPRQHWKFVKEYDGWPLHPGHSPNSPYAKRLKACGKYPDF